MLKLWEHQLKAIEQAKNLNEFALFHEMGAGKTATCIHIMRHKSNERKRLLRTLIFCPPIVIENWKREWLAHSKVDPKKVICLYGSGKKRLEIFKELSKEPHIFITNYESLLMEDLYEAFKAWNPDVVVCDESQRVRSHDAKRSKLMERLVNKDPTRRPLVYLLSGSPVLNSPMDLFQQYKILDGGKTFTNNFFKFRAMYFRDKNAGMPKQSYFPNWQPIQGALEEISKKMSVNSMRVLKKDCMDLPPLVRQEILVDMTPSQKRMYDSMLKDFVAYFTQDGKEHVATAQLALTKGMRLMQMASGFIKTVDDLEVDIEKEFNPKQQALYELLWDLTPGNKVLVWCVWRKNYEHIRAVCDKLKVKYLEMNGEQGSAKNMQSAKDFESDDSVRVMIGHPGSGGVGVNLVSASYSVFYSRGFSLEHDIQAEARNYRGGSERHEKVTRIDLVTKGTIEEEVTKRLASKQNISESLLKEITLNLKA